MSMLDQTQKIQMLKSMMVIREFEAVIKRLYKDGFVEGAIHCYTGQEAVAVGVCNALRKTDYIFSTHRGHGHAIAKGCDLNATFAELMGKKTGLSKGMGGSMHLFDISNGLMGGNGIVGGGLPLSLGTAYASKYNNDDKVTICFFSDGASNQGTFNESLNMASLWKLPLVYVCENNLFAATTPSFKTLADPDISKRAAGYAMPGVIADGNDIFDVYEKTLEAVARARRGEGPTLLECKTYRVEGHCMVINDLPQHRPKEEVASWYEKDPIDVMEKKLISEFGMSTDIRKKLAAEIEKEFSEAIAYAKSSPPADIDDFKMNIERRYQL